MKVKSLYLLILFALFSCKEQVKVEKILPEKPVIVPDYAGATIPPNIAPLNFALQAGEKEAQVTFSSGKESFQIRAKKGRFVIPASDWKKLLQVATGKSIEISIAVKKENEWIGYAPLTITVAADPVDSYLAYRLIEPGYELWNRMGIYQRNLENYEESAIIENKMSGNNCVNCHSFCMQNPDKMLFHMRETYPGTLLIDGDKIEKLNTKTDQTVSSLVYPSWHPSGKYVAFSVNKTNQAFHLNDKNRIEVYDEESDVVVYDIEKHEIITTPLLFSKSSFETFPTFSPDGKTLFFCSADTCVIPLKFNQVKYSLCSISFDPSAGTFGTQTDTLYNALTGGKSVSFPRVSPDGKFLLYTLSGYGNFSIWHKDADLYMADLETGNNFPLNDWNSQDTESYHSWSSNSRWVVFLVPGVLTVYIRVLILLI